MLSTGGRKNYNEIIIIIIITTTTTATGFITIVDKPMQCTLTS